MALTVLLTNIAMSERSGTAIQVRNIALALRQRGHHPIVYSPIVGEIAEDLRSAAIPVLDDIGMLDEPVDIIHGNHLPTTATAIARLPDVAAIYFSNSSDGWHDGPPPLPTIHRYIASDEAVVERLTKDPAIAAEKIRTMLNPVDLERFGPGPALPKRPRRALAFAKNLDHLPAIEAACRAKDIALDVCGYAVGNPAAEPERLTPQYDLVFASAIAAMEAMATGRAVVVCDGRGLAGMATSRRFDVWRPKNFGLWTLLEPLTPAAVGAEIEAYDPADASVVSERIRAEAGLARYTDELVALYNEVIAEHRDAPPSRDEIARALARHLQIWSPRLDRSWPATNADGVPSIRVERPGRAGPAVLRAGKIVDFAAAGEDHQFTPLRGFSNREVAGIWTIGERATMRLRLEGNPARDRKLEFTVKPLLARRHPVQTVELRVNGAPVGQWRFNYARDARLCRRWLHIPASAIGPDGLVLLDMRISNPYSPKALGMNKDERLLGIMLADARLLKVRFRSGMTGLVRRLFRQQGNSDTSVPNP